jgi:protein-disulfide isomerase-like protein with CxxC motif
VQAIEVLHFSDPGCPWAYSARPAHARLRWRFADQLAWRLVVIGLSESAEAYERRGFTPQRAVDGQRVFRERFGMPFALLAKPRMAGTGRACRAIVAARERAPELAEDALRALQLLQFTTARPLDDEAAIREALDAVAGLDAELAISRLDHPDVEAAYQADRALARSAQGGPTEAQGRHSTSDGPVRFTAPSLLFRHPDGRSFEAGGFQPFEAYDLALANLDPTLERRSPPQDALTALRAFPEGLTTAEVASLLRPSDLVDADLPAAEDELARLAAEGAIDRRPAGQDALWREAAASPAAPARAA